MQMNEWWRGCLRGVLPLVPVLAVGVAIPAHAQQGFPGGLGCPTATGAASCSFVDPAGLADTAEPGSVLVFPKFGKGSVTLDNGAVEPRTQIEIGAVCQAGAAGTVAPGTSPQICPERDIFIEVHWVCPGTTVGQEQSVCLENDFVVRTTTYGKIVFNPDGVAASNGRITGFPATSNFGTTPVPSALCQAGYAIAFVVRSASDRTPIALDVLVGDSVQRISGPDLQSYSALAIQSVNNDGKAIELVNDPEGGTKTPSLPFDGQPSRYQMVSGQLWGDIRFTQLGSAPFAETMLILLSLDVRSNLVNDTTHVNLDFYNQKEIPVSEVTTFDCWEQVRLTDIDPVNLTNTGMGTPFGMFVTGQAFNARNGHFVTLLGLVQTLEGPASPLVGPGGTANRSYTVRPSNNSIPVPTYFTFD